MYLWAPPPSAPLSSPSPLPSPLSPLPQEVQQEPFHPQGQGQGQEQGAVHPAKEHKTQVRPMGLNLKRHLTSAQQPVRLLPPQSPQGL